jgi:hypothetical protein
MRLEHVCDMELAYREEPLYGRGLVLVRPYGGEEGAGYGEGDGHVTGERLRGPLRWVNHPHRRSDRVMLPDAHGCIWTDDGAAVLFTLQGRTVFSGDQGRQLLSVLFEADDARYQWLNDTFCILEGAYDRTTMTMRARVYACVSDLA